jgi:hypothetical protein
MVDNGDVTASVLLVLLPPVELVVDGVDGFENNVPIKLTVHS